MPAPIEKKKLPGSMCVIIYDVCGALISAYPGNSILRKVIPNCLRIFKIKTQIYNGIFECYHQNRKPDEQRMMDFAGYWQLQLLVGIKRREFYLEKIRKNGKLSEFSAP